MTTVKIKTKTQGTRLFCKNVKLQNNKTLPYAEKRGKVFKPITEEQWEFVEQCVS